MITRSKKKIYEFGIQECIICNLRVTAFNVALPSCGHFVCLKCASIMLQKEYNKCSVCRKDLVDGTNAESFVLFGNMQFYNRLKKTCSFLST